MTVKSLAFFRLEAGPHVGAGHAMRCSVLADALVEKGWECSFVTSQETYEFIPALSRFERSDPETFYANPLKGDLLVVDHYGLDASYEHYFRPYAERIMVIDDLADRKHDCDILLDQTFGRNAEDYRPLVPEACEILAGSDYVLLRPEFIKLRPQALKKRRETTEIKKILVTMGGSDPKNFTLDALKLIKESGFKGDIDAVLGFAAPHRTQVQSFIDTMPNRVTLHINADMPRLIYEADLAIGAAGSSVWERCCLGLPQFLMAVAENQEGNLSIFTKLEHINLFNFFSGNLAGNSMKNFSQGMVVDGFGINRLLRKLKTSDFNKEIAFRKVKNLDQNLIYRWQNMKDVRTYFNNSAPPSLSEHKLWFSKRIVQFENPYWVVCYKGQDCGMVSLSYEHSKHYYDLSWFIIPEQRGLGLGIEALKFAIHMVYPLKIHAFVKDNNVVSHKIFKKLQFLRESNNSYVSR